MLTFFRRIRKGLLGEGAISKYLLYATGEIALVVIGILIALQINNWNQERNERRLEKSTLMEISSDLAKDTTRISEDIRQMQNSMEIITSLIEHIETKKPFKSMLKSSFMLSYAANGATYDKFNSASFDFLKERGLDIVSDPEMRRKIVEYYTVEYAEIEGWFMNLNIVWRLQANRLYDNFKITTGTNDILVMYPNDYDQLLNNQKLMDPFHHFKALILVSVNNLNSMLEKTQELLHLIEGELDEKE